MEIKHVEGANKGKIMVYALSTCMWCRKAKTLLNDLGVEYYFVDVDQLPGEEQASVKADVRRWNPQGSFPTIIIDDRECISGFDESEIRQALGNG